MASLDCNEYDNLKRRNFGPYSDGHQVMYEVPIALLSHKRWSICEAGFGIGWGLGRMIEENVIQHYMGFEPCAESYEYVRKIYHGNELLTLKREGFEYPGREFDHVFCIETIEHVPMEGHAKFLADLRKTTERTLWFSTPDVRKHKTEGVRIWEEWKAMLHEAGFPNVTVHREQWTVLFVAQ